MLVAGAVVVLLLLGLNTVVLRGGGTADEGTVAPVASEGTPTTDPAVPTRGTTATDGPATTAAPAPATTATPVPPTIEGDPAQPLPTDGTAQAVLPVGTCLVGTGRPTNVASVTPAGCEPEHTGEVYLSVILTQPADAPYPGRDPLEQDARLLCQGDAFTAYIGTPYAQSRYLAYALLPTEESWAAGDRDVSCVVYDIAGPTTGSVQGSGL